MGRTFFMLWKRVSEYLFLLTFGGTLYYLIEICYRGFSHWSMFLLGGICFAFLWWQGDSLRWSEPIWLQTIRAVIFVTACEFITGMIVNKWLGLNVWDYSDQPYHLFGQICLPFACCFLVLSFFGILLSGKIMHYIFQEKNPKYRFI